MNRRKVWRTTKRALALLWLALACAPLIAEAQDARAIDVTTSPFSSVPYRVGERLSYNVSFSNFPVAAHIEMLVAGRGQLFGREGVELRAHVETMGVVSAALYSVNNDYTSFVDPATGLPYRVQQVIREGAQSSAFPADLGQTPQPLNTFPGSFDFLSALYRARALPLADGAVYRLTAQNGAVSYDCELRVVGREVVKTNVGSSNVVVTQVRVLKNRAANDYRVRVYFADDERHLPVLITAQHSAGEIRAELASAELLTEAMLPPTGTKPLPVPPPQQQVAPPTGERAVPPQGGTPPANVRPGATRPTGGGATTPAAGATGTADLPDLPFKVGDDLNFNFYIGTTPQQVGLGRFQVRARGRYFGRDGLLFTAQMQTSGPGQRLFPVNDQISSYVDASTLLPFRTELRLQEGNRRANFTVSVEQNQGRALFDDGTRVDMPVATHDLLSVFFALRSFDLTVGRQTRVSLLVNKRPRLLTVIALARETLELNGRRVPAIQLSLATSDPQSAALALRLWVSDDRRRLPLRLTAQTPLGPLRADLAIIPVSVQ
ncbi:MAG TPA: DUF3108 domain-containing protein [Pyrinomonadaceae bacterium]|nr:DUF3108 domain-containing protein [Pyrinomonadaceae bacterium]